MFNQVAFWWELAQSRGVLRHLLRVTRWMKMGILFFRVLGKLKVEGLTKAALKDTLDARLSPFLQHPYYSIRFLNYKFTMMGEVTKPGIVSIPGERINMLEAIALGGDLTPYANRDSVFIIRENNNKREFAWMNLTKPEIMASPYFYIQQNDIVIVEPNKKKSVANDIVTARNISLALAIYFNLCHCI